MYLLLRGLPLLFWYLYQMSMRYPEIPYPIHWIDTNEALLELSNQLAFVRLLAIDTEFDRFRRKYGINLELIQLFDGEAVYLIRVGALSNLLSLKPIIENPAVIKLLYSGSEDIQVFKVNGIAPKGVYDLQPASQLSGFSAMSLAGLLQEVLGVSFDKSKQTSDWSKPQLDREQIVYAANDVIYLVPLYNQIKEGAARFCTTDFINEENALLEVVEVSETKPRLKQRHRENFNRHEQALILELMHVRDGLGQILNKPPHFVLSDGHIEDIVSRRDNYAGTEQLKAYSAFFRRGYDFLSKADRDIRAALTMPWPPPKTVHARNDLPRLQKVVLSNEKIEDLLQSYTLYLNEQYVESVATYLCNGIRRYLRELMAGADDFNFPPYRRKLFHQYLNTSGFDLNQLVEA